MESICDKQILGFSKVTVQVSYIYTPIIVFLAEALKAILQNNSIEEQANGPDHKVIINQQYADDIIWITNMEILKENLKKEVSSTLKEKNKKV